MISTLAFTKILGLPLIAWGGMLGLIMMIFVAVIGALNLRGIRLLNLKWHRGLALLAIIIAILHGFIGTLALLGY
ncbi:MAG: hypothetical protein WCX71_00755 [Candidatus Buchananbacteria bacterium]